MTGRTARRILHLAAAAVCGLSAAGCASLTDPFMGVPEWQTVHYGEDHPVLDGVPRITAVQDREYGHYVRSASTGRIVAREVRGDWVYYAVASRRVVQGPGAGPSGGGRAVAVVYERFRVKQPPRPAPKPRPRLPDQETEPPEDGTVVPPGPEVEEMKKRMEEEFEKRRQEQGGPKVIPPESSKDKE
jgi:hypothetical protein